jgi:hypothetical protein
MELRVSTLLDHEFRKVEGCPKARSFNLLSVYLRHMEQAVVKTSFKRMGKPGHCKLVSLLASVEPKEPAKFPCELGFLCALLDISCVGPFPGIPQFPGLQCGPFERSVAAMSRKDGRPLRPRASHSCTKGLKCLRVVAGLIQLVSKILVLELLPNTCDP